MQLTFFEEQNTQGLEETPGMAGGVTEENWSHRRNYMASAAASSLRSSRRCTCLNQPGSAPCRWHGYMLPRQNMRRNSGNKEIIRRAITHPSGR
ncbi:NAC domain protein [Hibiscus syriacus]|uniref:NAC domain protein n=1 Tax=Hibiscus syriacus TaxID=106335 RepID=A0A6A3BB13_HIBSY|nr:NAC domain protein [Hibiscus syriacus]